MPSPTPPTGPHTPITNRAVSESSVLTPMESAGSEGFGNVQAIAEDYQSELLPRPEVATLESFVENTIPDLSGLSDIGVASFGEPPSLEAIIGTDERIQIQETEKYPWRITASLLMTAADNSQWIGTGWFIGPRTLITAGHCVYIKGSGVQGRDGWIKKMQVMPGRNGNKLPFGAITATEFWTVKGWAEEGSEIYDYAAIILPAPFPQDLGFFGFGVFPDNELLKATANVEGYPGDKPSGTIWYDNRQISSVNPDKVYYAADTAGGQSGACVYIIKNGKRIGIAVHAYGGKTANSGTRISTQVYNNLEAWKKV